MAIAAADAKSMLLKRAIEETMTGVFDRFCPEWQMVGCDLRQQEDFRMMEHEVIVRMRFQPDDAVPYKRAAPSELAVRKPSPLELFDPRAADEDFGSF